MKKLKRIVSLAFLGFTLAACSSVADVDITGETSTWHVQTLSFAGPLVSEAPETFSNYRMDVVFLHEDGDMFKIPGYFAGDGNAAQNNAEEGNIWQVKFVPSKPGTWKYEASLISGSNTAIDDQADFASAGYFDGDTGSVKIRAVALDPKARDFRKQGMLVDIRERYLQFQGTKKYYVKTGAGSPENMLAYADFDGTYDAGGTYFPALGENQLHEFSPHVKDARPTDPTWQEGKGRNILGAVNYLSDVGVNAQYMLSMNVEGDGQDVWPWVSDDNPYIFDVSKLAQWERVLTHMDHKGIVKDLILGETENESWFEVVDQTDPTFSDARKLYYREMVARFGHLLGLVWNIGEEHGADGNSGNERYRKATTANQRRQFSKYIADLDPYDHAIVSHNWPDSEEQTYAPKLGDEYFSGISLQAHHNYGEKIIEWTQRSAEAGRPWMINVDEPLGWEFGARPDSEVENRSLELDTVLWPTLLAGGSGVDWYFGWQNNAPTSDLSNEDMRSRHNLWVESASVRKWWEDNVPFYEMDWQSIDGSKPSLSVVENDASGKSTVTSVSRNDDGQIALTKSIKVKGISKETVTVFNPESP